MADRRGRLLPATYTNDVIYIHPTPLPGLMTRCSVGENSQLTLTSFGQREARFSGRLGRMEKRGGGRRGGGGGQGIAR